MRTRPDGDYLVGAMTSVQGFDALRLWAKRADQGMNTERTPEVLAADRADEVQELSWLALSAGLRRGQCF